MICCSMHNQLELYEHHRQGLQVKPLQCVTSVHTACHLTDHEYLQGLVWHMRQSVETNDSTSLKRLEQV